MKRIIQILIFTIFSTLCGCDEKQNDDSTVKEEKYYIEINGVRKSLIQTQESTYSSAIGRSCYYFNSSTGKCDTKYISIDIVDSNHELFVNLLPNYTQRIQLLFVTNLSNYSGIYKTNSNSSSNLEDNKIYAALIIDGKTTILAENNQNVTLIPQGDNFELRFKEIYYGSNILSGHITLTLN